MEKKKKKIRKYEWIIGGDFNIKHPDWGSSKNPINKGITLRKYIQNEKLQILNGQQPTRWYWHEGILKFSHIDITLATKRIAKTIVWRVLETPYNSDHYQIYMDIENQLAETKTLPKKEKKWRLTNNTKDWHTFNTHIIKNYDSIMHELDTIMNNRNLNNKKKGNRVTNTIIKIFLAAANKTFKKQYPEATWPQTISKKGRALSIVYHRLYRKIRKTRKPTKEQINQLKYIRRQKNKEIRNYKARVITRRFAQDNIHTKEGWQIAAEIRDISQTQGKKIPTLLDQNTEEVIATTPKEKVQVLNKYYHRHKNTQSLPEHYCWDQNRIIQPKCKPLPKQLRINERHETEPKHNPTIPQINTQTWETSNTQQQGVKFIKKLHKKFKNIIQEHVTNKWIRIQNPHKTYKQNTRYDYHIEKLNRDITIQETNRALSSFSNNKAYGPDEIHIKFLKKSRPHSTKILTKLINILMKLGYIPSKLKKRWIHAIVKPGKTGNIPKHLRPISLTSYIGKLLEKIIQYRLVTYLVQLELIDPSQFAYLPGRSTTDCIIFLLDRIQRNLKNTRNARSNVIFFDFSSAFDTVQHHILFWKLEHEYFIKGPILRIIKSLLTDRYTSVKIGGTLSKWLKDTIGVPQGGALSPLLYILYMDNLGVLNYFTGLQLGMFADDLCLFTRYETSLKQQEILQEGILFIQWYATQHGLQINMEKTKFKQFHNYKRVEPKNPRGIRLYFSHKIHNEYTKYNKQQIMKQDIQIQATEEPVRYLGIYLDTNLTFKEHTNKIKNKCYKMFYSISRQTRSVWRIQADTLWILMEVCVLSIFDYSAILWPHIKSTQRFEWMRLYNRIIKNIFRCTKGTNDIHILHHLYTKDLTKRMNLLNSKQFTRLLRIPKSNALQHIVEQEWWKIIRYQCYKSPNRMLTKEQFIAIKQWGTAKYNGKQIKAKIGTMIWKLLEVAIENQNDDVKYITPTLSMAQIEPRITSYMDLTNPWMKVNFDPTVFSDMPEIPYNPTKQLVTFTDGSVHEGIGGYGYLTIPMKLYNKWNYHSEKGFPSIHFEKKQHRKDFTEILKRNTTKHKKILSNFLSDRCTIEFCEAKAIADNLRDLLKMTKSSWLRQYKTLRIISDSQTVLNYIIGTYHIRTTTMKNLILDIIRHIHKLKQIYSIETILQWTPSHVDASFGNDYADYLAEKGRTQKRDQYRKSVTQWKYLTLKAAVNRNNYPIRKQQQSELTQSIQNSRFGKTYQYKPNYEKQQKLQWTRNYRKTLEHFERREIRILIAIRTGHDYYNFYRSQMRMTTESNCPCGHQQQTFKHILTKCTIQTITKTRNVIIQKYKEIYEHWKKNSPKQIKRKYQMANGQLPTIQYKQPRVYTDPPKFLPIQKQRTIQKLIVKLFKEGLKYTKLYETIKSR